MRTWKDVEKEIDEVLTDEEKQEIEFEKQVIEATIAARKKSNLTQQELGEKTGMKQSAIAKIENFVRTPQYTTLMKLLRPMGYTLKVVPIKIKENTVKDKEVKE